MKLIRKLDIRKDKNGYKRRWGLFWCADCLQEVERQMTQGKKQISCGSVQCVGKKGNFKHGETKTRLHRIWINMKQRVLNPNEHAYKDYGGRGITICNEWLEFIPFRDWALNNGYAENLQINRINNDGNYEPSNCNFKTPKENSRHRRGQKIKNKGMANEIRDLHIVEGWTQKQLAEKFDISVATISLIINNKIWV